MNATTASAWTARSADRSCGTWVSVISEKLKQIDWLVGGRRVRWRNGGLPATSFLTSRRRDCNAAVVEVHRAHFSEQLTLALERRPYIGENDIAELHDPR